jgi:hypothetical protein
MNKNIYLDDRLVFIFRLKISEERQNIDHETKFSAHDDDDHIIWPRKAQLQLN